MVLWVYSQVWLEPATGEYHQDILLRKYLWLIIDLVATDVYIFSS